jgi:hypothetical protein
MTLDELGSPVFIQRLVISPLTEEGFDAASKLAMCESVAQGFLPQKLTNEAVLLTRKTTLVRVVDSFLLFWPESLLERTD